MIKHIVRGFLLGGCAAYGHSCFGGHGKRSGAQAADSGPKLPDCKDDTYGSNVIAFTNGVIGCSRT